MILVINGEAKVVTDDATHIDYEEVVERAGHTGSPTMTYSHGAEGARLGTLSPGQSVAIVEGMIFGVHHTDNA